MISLEVTINDINILFQGTALADKLSNPEHDAECMNVLMSISELYGEYLKKFSNIHHSPLLFNNNTTACANLLKRVKVPSICSYIPTSACGLLR